MYDRYPGQKNSPVVIDVDGLTKQFGSLTAVDGVSFRIHKGEIVGLLGPNGAGKTTTLRMLSTFLPATAGSVRIDGMDVLRYSIEVRQRIGYLPESVPLYGEMRVSEYLDFRGRLKGLNAAHIRERMDVVLTACDLADVRNSIIGTLSKGYRQRVGLADSLLHEPAVLILDEPTLGLDPNQIRQIRGLIRGLSANHTVLLSSHILSEVEMVCQRVLIMNKGRIVASDTTGNLVALSKGNITAILQVQGPEEQVVQALGGVPGVRVVKPAGNGDWTEYVCECESDKDPCPALFRVVADHGWVLRELRTEKRNLEDVFVQMTNGSGEA